MNNKITSLNKWQKILLLTVLSVIFLLVFSPHFSYPFPYHVDEWHHIYEASRFGDTSGFISRESYFRSNGVESGFQFVLFLIGRLFDLVTIYQYLPAIWVILSALSIFYVTFKKTNGDFTVSIFAVIFFGSLKSNVNLLGTWFFTPLSFAIPFIFLYFYLFDTGLEEKNIRKLWLSAFIMAVMSITHPPSVLFSLPILFGFLIFRYKKVKEFPLAFILLFSVTLIGILVYKMGTGISTIKLVPALLKDIIFPEGWGVIEHKNSIFELYSLVPLIFALFGIFILLRYKEATKRYLLYLLWPAILLFIVVVFRLSGYSFFVPYQRAFYYLALGLPMLSALGMAFLLDVINESYGRKFVWVLIPIVLVLSYIPYYNAPRQYEIYRLISEDDYVTLMYLKSLPKVRIMAPSSFSSALFPVSGHKEVASTAFYGNSKNNDAFFAEKDCVKKEKLINKFKVKMVVSPSEIDCQWNLLQKVGGNYVYRVENLK